MPRVPYYYHGEIMAHTLIPAGARQMSGSVLDFEVRHYSIQYADLSLAFPKVCLAYDVGKLKSDRRVIINKESRL
jgi:hypothetical protein